MGIPGFPANERHYDMTKDNYMETPWNTPFIAQRADPYILHHEDRYYFTASVPE
jgi:hypothetical protein